MAEDRTYGIKKAAIELGMIVLAAIYAFPIYVLIILAFKSQSEWQTDPLSLPTSLYLENFTSAWSEGYLGASLFASGVVLVGSLLLLVSAGSMAAYYIVRSTARFGYGLYIFFLVGMILPFQLAMIPLYDLMGQLGLLGSPISLILFYGGLQMPMTVFLYAGFLRTIPMAYEEAAMIDGASRWQAFYLVIFPMLRPVTGTVLILNGVTVWNDFLTPLLYLSGTDWATVPVAVYSFVDQFVTEWGLIFAALLIGILPVFVAFLLLQRHMIRGFASGVKG